jgi:hypothetical protein
VVERLVLKYERSNSAATRAGGDVMSERRMSAHRRKPPRAAAFIGDGVRVANAERDACARFSVMAERQGAGPMTMGPIIP